MNTRYEVVGFARIARTQLKKHPAADLPIKDDDKAALRGSIEERGMLQPLLVLDERDSVDGMFLVVDGCNRLDSAPDGAELPCVLVQTDDPRSVALECLSSGRRRGPGQRIMAFLMMNKRDVLKAAEIGEKIASGGRNPHVAVSNETARNIGVLEHFSTKAIAERLKVSKEDVVRAVELFRCVEEGRVPAVGFDKLNRWGEKLDLSDPEDKRAHGLLVEVLNGVMSGGTAVRTWRKAYGGKLPTTGPAGRPDIQHGSLFQRGLQHLRTVLKAKAWHTIKAAERERLTGLFDEVVGMLPDELMVRLPRK